MNKLLTTSFAISLAISQIVITTTTSLAAIPLLNYTCPGQIEVHADQGGPVFINGKKAKLKVFNKNYYEAKGSGVTISISINPDGTPSVSYTGTGRHNGICSPSEATSTNSNYKSSTSKAESACLDAVAKKVGVSRSQVSTIKVLNSEAGVGVTVKVPGAQAPWSCLSDTKGKVQGVSYTGSEGAL